MYRQATTGHVDAITGDYLAEFNMALNAEGKASGIHPGWEKTAWEALEMSLETIAAKKIKVVINGGALNPKGLALKTFEVVSSTCFDYKMLIMIGQAKEARPFGCICLR